MSVYLCIIYWGWIFIPFWCYYFRDSGVSLDSSWPFALTSCYFFLLSVVPILSLMFLVSGLGLEIKEAEIKTRQTHTMHKILSSKGTRLATEGWNKVRLGSDVGMSALAPVGLTILVATRLNMNPPNPYDPTTMPVTRPLWSGKYSMEHTSGII